MAIKKKPVPSKKLKSVSKKTIKQPLKNAAKKIIKKVAKVIAKAKKKKVSAIPKGYHGITPYLIVTHAVKAIDFYKKVFSAKEVMRMERPNGKIMHAELKIGDAKFMLGDECPEMKQEMQSKGPLGYGCSPVSIHLYVKKVDEVIDAAVKAGAKLLKSPEDMFYGDRFGAIEDPYGHRWAIATHIKDVTPAQMKKRAAELFK